MVTDFYYLVVHQQWIYSTNQSIDVREYENLLEALIVATSKPLYEEYSKVEVRGFDPEFEHQAPVHKRFKNASYKRFNNGREPLSIVLFNKAASSVEQIAVYGIKYISTVALNARIAAEDTLSEDEAFFAGVPKYTTKASSHKLASTVRAHQRSAAFDERKWMRKSKTVQVELPRSGIIDLPISRSSSMASSASTLLSSTGNSARSSAATTPSSSSNSLAEWFEGMKGHKHDALSASAIYHPRKTKLETPRDVSQTVEYDGSDEDDENDYEDPKYVNKHKLMHGKVGKRCPYDQFEAYQYTYFRTFKTVAKCVPASEDEDALVREIDSRRGRLAAQAVREAKLREEALVDPFADFDYACSRSVLDGF